MEFANVVTVDVLKTQLADRLATIQDTQKRVNELVQETEKLKANMVANDGAVQQLKILIEMCEPKEGTNVPDLEANTEDGGASTESVADSSTSEEQ